MGLVGGDGVVEGAVVVAEALGVRADVDGCGANLAGGGFTPVVDAFGVDGVAAGCGAATAAVSTTGAGAGVGIPIFAGGGAFFGGAFAAGSTYKAASTTFEDWNHPAALVLLLVP